VTPGLYRYFQIDVEVGIAAKIGVKSDSNPIDVILKMTLELGGNDDD